MNKLILILTILSVNLSALDVVVISGSLRSESLNKKLAKESASLASERGHRVTYFDLKEFPLPFFNEDRERDFGMPSNAKTIRRAIVKSDAVIITSPNYNGSMPGVLKNLLDWISRSEDGQDARDVFKKKQVLIMSASGGKSGGSGGLSSLEHVVEKLGGHVKAKFSLGKAHTKFNDANRLSDPHEKENLIAIIKVIEKK